MALSALERQSLLHQAANDFGFETMEEMFAATCFDSVVPGICYRCGYTTEVEPDGRGWCEECNKPTVISVLLLGGLI